MTFKIPEDLTALDNEALEALMAEASEIVSGLTEESSDEEIEAAEPVAAFLDAARNEVGVREQAAVERAERIERIRNSAQPAEGEGDEGDGVEGDGVEGDGAEGEGDGAQEVVDEAERIAAEEEERSRVAASAKKAVFTPKRAVTARAAAKKGKDDLPPAKPMPSLVAAAGAPGFTPGHKFASLKDASQAIFNRFDSYPADYTPGMKSKDGALVMTLPENKWRQDQRDISEMLWAISDEARATSIATLTAAGGWGAPSEQVLDFCAPEQLDGLVNIPEFTLTRPGVSYTRGPSFTDVLGSGTGFWDMTEAVAEAGVVQKTSLRPSIPSFVEKRPDAVGVMMEAGLLLRAGWPELVERYARLALLAHQYKMNQKTLNQIHAFTGAATAINTGFGNELDVLHVIEMVAYGERQRNFLADNTVLECLLPAWVRPAIRAGLAQRNGVDTITVTNAQIDGHFAARGVRVQWLKGYQDAALASGIMVTYPDTLELVMFPAGTYVRGVLPVISLDTIYDSVNLKKNDYVHLFVEQGVLMTNPCGDGRRISLPFLINGRRANVSDINDDLFNAAEA